MMRQLTLINLRQHHSHSGEDSDQWYTPNTPEQPILKLVALALGGVIGLDPTSDPDCRTPARRHITESENCLAQQANGETIFCNPPFSTPLPFMRWVIDQVESGRSPQAIMLCKIGVLSNQGTGALIRDHCSASCEWMHNGRIRFIPGDGVLTRLEREFSQGKRKAPTVNGADFDCVLLNFGCTEQRFIHVFEPYGNVALRPTGLRRGWCP
ncbi:MAG: DNA N-6-adenine-methyltransferase [Cyanobacteria bacterium P01_E01_bin.6]